MAANVMLAIDEKKATAADLYGPLRQYIVSAYSECEAAMADDDLCAVRDLRAAAVETPSLPDPSSLEQRRSALLAYARALALVERRFLISPDRAHVHSLSFTWHDAFKTNKKVSLPSVHLERAAVLFNIGAVYSQIGLAADRVTDVGNRTACDAFQSAARAFALLRESGLAAKAVAAGSTTIDMTPDCAGMLEKLMLAQAHECFFENVIAGGKSPTLCSKVARQVGVFYEEAYAALCAPALSQHIYKTWVPHAQLKAAQFNAEACYRCSPDLHQQEEIAQDFAPLAEVRKAAKGIGAPLDSVNKLENKMKTNLDMSMKESDNVHLMRIPNYGTLGALSAASLVKSSSLAEVLDNSKERLVSLLVTDGRTKALSMLKEKKRKDDILPKLMASVESHDVLFKEEIVKYDPTCSEIADNISGLKYEQFLLQKQAQNERFAAVFNLDDFEVADTLGPLPAVSFVKSTSVAEVLDPRKESLFLSFVPDGSTEPYTETVDGSIKIPCMEMIKEPCRKLEGFNLASPADKLLCSAHAHDDYMCHLIDMATSAAPRSILDIPDDILVVIADYLQSAHQVERMRLVCRAWSNALPSRLGPFLVISLSEATRLDRVWFLEINDALDPVDGLPRLERAFYPGIIPPAGTVCWGSAQGMMAMVVIPPDEINLFLYCLHCAEMRALPPAGPGMTPTGMFFRAAQLHDHFMVALIPNVEEGRLLNDVINWHDPEGGHQWVLYAGLEEHGVTSVAFIPSVLMGVATRQEVIIDEISRPVQNIDDLIFIDLPDRDPLLIPWEDNHSHVFVCEGILYLCRIFDRYASSGITVEVHLHRLENDPAHGYQLIRSSYIGPYSVFLGPNQGIVLPSLEGCIGRMSNTIYVEDWSQMLREPRVLAVNLSSQIVTHIDFPSALAEDNDLHRFLPAVWVCSPAERNMFGNCYCSRGQFTR